VLFGICPGRTRRVPYDEPHAGRPAVLRARRKGPRVSTKLRLLDRMWAGTIAVVSFPNLPPQTPESMIGFLRAVHEAGHPGMLHAKRSGSWRLDPVQLSDLTLDAPGLVVDLRDTPDDEVKDRILNGDLLDHPRWRMRAFLSETQTFVAVDHSIAGAAGMLVVSGYLRSYLRGERFTYPPQTAARYRHLLAAMVLTYATRRARLRDGVRTLRESMAAGRAAGRGTESVAVVRHQHRVLPDSAFEQFSIWRKKESPSPSAALGVVVAFLRAARRSGLDLSDHVVEGTVDLTRYHPTSLGRFDSNLIGYVSLDAGTMMDDRVSETSKRWNGALASGAPGLRVLLRSVFLTRKPRPFAEPGHAAPSPAARRLSYSYIRFPGMVDEVSEVPVLTATFFRVAPGCLNVTTDAVKGGQIINVSYDATYVDDDAVRETLDRLVTDFIDLLDEDD
jgi:hypothetical protein